MKYEDNSMRHIGDPGRCTLLEHIIELNPNANLLREGARRISRDKAEKPNREICSCWP